MNIILNTLLEMGVSMNDLGDLVRFLCSTGRLDTLNIIIDHGFDVNVIKLNRSDYCATPLMIACSEASTASRTVSGSVVSFLLSNGADANIVDDFGETVR